MKMGFFDLFKPKWKHSNPDVRKTALIFIDNQKILEKVAQNDKNEYVRSAAVKKLSNQELLAQIIENDKDYSVREVAVEKLTDMNYVMTLAKTNKCSYVRATAIKKAGKLLGQPFLEKAAETDNDAFVRSAAVQFLENRDLKIKIAENDPAYLVRFAGFISQGLGNDFARKMATEYGEIIKLRNK